MFDEALVVQLNPTECGCDVVAAPVPVTGTVLGAVDASLTSERVPLTLPDVVGANFTTTGRLCPAAIVVGSVNPPKLNPAPVILACEMVTGAVLAETVTVWEALLPTLTDPKLRAVGATTTVPTSDWTVMFSELL